MTALSWRRPDTYHIATACGRFTVARRRVNAVDHYIAYRREPKIDVVLAHELAAVTVGERATDAERMAAIKAMQSVCEAACTA